MQKKLGEGRPMKIIEAMKKIKDLRRKFDDLKADIALHCAHMDYEKPVYGDTQRVKVTGWLQACDDIADEILTLRVRIQNTNLVTNVTVELAGKKISKTIAEWIHRRRDLAKLQESVYLVMSDATLANSRRLREGRVKESSGQDRDVTIIRYFDPSLRDQKIDMFRSEPLQIDAALEIANAVTDLVEI